MFFSIFVNSIIVWFLLIMENNVHAFTPVDRTDIFCQGELLHTVQLSKIFEDSKTFVDMKMKYPPSKILSNFENFMKNHQSEPSKDKVKQFVFDNFETTEGEYRKWIPEDWRDDPEFLKSIPDDNYRKFGCELHKIWKNLGRKLTENIGDEIDKISLILTPNPVVVPGGRFREFYYWDSYWIVRGLLISEMYTTVKGMLNNYLYIVEKYGYIPNGGRIYYIGRSQPPMLIPTFKQYMDAKNDIDFLKESIETLEKEFDFWLTKRSKIVKHNGKEYKLASYGDDSQGPRAESYAEDVDFASKFDKEDLKASFYHQTKSACESGWDFSSRWFINNSSNKGTLEDIKATSIIPVDLNALLYGNAVILSDFHKILGNLERAEYYKGLGEEWLKSVTEVLWHEETGTWLDYDVENGIRRDYFHASNLVPLWTGCYEKSLEKEVVESNLRYMENKNVLNFPGGIPQTLEHTGEQWDFPNAWAPSQHMIIFGLKKTNHPEAQRVAKELATKWLTSNHEAFLKTKHMSEKYDATIVGQSGGGGEYKVQFGFGWTNGVVLDILVNFFSDS